jgi:hypothetical protein
MATAATTDVSRTTPINHIFSGAHVRVERREMCCCGGWCQGRNFEQANGKGARGLAESRHQPRCSEIHL